MFLSNSGFYLAFNSSFKDRVKTITTDVTITNLIEKWSYNSDFA
jgi:hypothetical protein